jgi:hypothetical protein
MLGQVWTGRKAVQVPAQLKAAGTVAAQLSVVQVVAKVIVLAPVQKVGTW